MKMLSPYAGHGDQGPETRRELHSSFQQNPVIPVSGFRFLVSSFHSGYAFLVTVLVIGTIATATATSLMLLGWAAEQNGFLIERSAQAEENAKSCIERTLRTLRLVPSYAGDETLALSKGSCTIHPVAGDGVNDRRICVEGKSGESMRRFELTVEELFPRVITSSFAEVASFTQCP